MKDKTTTGELASTATFDAILKVSDQCVRDAVEHKRLECEAHGSNWTDAHALLWLLDYGARIYLATVPKEKGK